MPRGYFITFEGLDGSGKSTQIKRLAAWFESLHEVSAGRVPVHFAAGPLVTRQPGGTELGDRIRALTLDSQGEAVAPMAEMALMFADRAQSIAGLILPALGEGRVVLCDRFTDSTEAYQGGGRRLGSQIVLDLHRLICGDLQPDLTILLLPPIETSLKRARRRNERSARNGRDESRFENEEIAFHTRVRDKYLEIARREPHRVALIEGDLSVDEVHARVVASVENGLRKRMDI